MMDREIILSERKEGIREKKVVPVTRFELNEIKKHFDDSISAVKSQFIVADELLKHGKNIEAEYIWRSQIIFIESAFDYYMHEITKYGLTQIFDEKWKPTKRYQNIMVDMKHISMAFREGKDSGWFLEYINSYYEKDTLVSFESFKKQINLLGIGIKDIADAAFYERGETENTKDKLKRRLNQLFYRRNLIAHQADRSHLNAELHGISCELVEQYISDMNSIVEAIHKELDNL